MNMKNKNYPGRWIIQMIQVSLIFAIFFFAMDALQQWEYQQYQLETAEGDYSLSQMEPAFTSYDYYNFAFAHQTAGDYYEAVADYSRALELHPDLFSAMLNRGVAYEQLNDAASALPDLAGWLERPDVTVQDMGLVTSLTMGAQPLANYEAEHNDDFRRYSYSVNMLPNHVLEYRLHLRAGETLRVDMTSVVTDEVDPLIVLLGTDGQPVAASDDIRRQDGSLISADSRIEQYPVQHSGTYTLRVSHAGGGDWGKLDAQITIEH